VLNFLTLCYLFETTLSNKPLKSTKYCKTILLLDCEEESKCDEQMTDYDSEVDENDIKNATDYRTVS